MAWAVWITGLPGSGKTTISELLKKRLEEKGVRSIVLSIDKVRDDYNLKEYDFEGRKKAYGKMIDVGQKLLREGNNIIFDATGNYRIFRELARRRIKDFAEIYLKCPIKVCMDREFQRDEKRAYLVYKQKRYVPGIQVDYEEPENPELTIETDKKSPEESVGLILRRLKDMLR